MSEELTELFDPAVVQVEGERRVRAAAFSGGLEKVARGMWEVEDGTLELIVYAFKEDIPESCGMTKASWVEKHFGYRKLDVDQRREIVTMLHEEELSLREIAAATGASKSTVADDLAVQNRTKEPSPQAPEEDAPVQNWTSPPHVAENAGDNEWYTPFDETPEPESEPPADDKWQGDKGVLINTGEDDWPTPPHVVAAVVETLGAIDLDPCASAAGRVPAATCYTVEDDGLSKPWLGRVYMNPPYGRVIGDWVEKLQQEFTEGGTTEYVALVPARTDTAWFDILRDSYLCFIRGRLTFGNAKQGAPFPSVAAYRGPNAQRFAMAFADYGDIWQRVAP